MVKLLHLPGAKIGRGRRDEANRMFYATVATHGVDISRHEPSAVEHLCAATELLTPEVLDLLCDDELPQGLEHIRDESIRIGFELAVPTKLPLEAEFVHRWLEATERLLAEGKSPAEVEVMVSLFRIKPVPDEPVPGA